MTGLLSWLLLCYASVSGRETRNLFIQYRFNDPPDSTQATPDAGSGVATFGNLSVDLTYATWNNESAGVAPQPTSAFLMCMYAGIRLGTNGGNVSGIGVPRIQSKNISYTSAPNTTRSWLIELWVSMPGGLPTCDNLQCPVVLAITKVTQ